MQADPCPAGRLCARLRCLAVALAAAAGVCGCASTAQPPMPAPPPVAAQPAAPPTAPAAPPAAAVAASVDAMLAYADRVRNLQPPDLAQEIARLGDPQDSASRQMQLAIALSTARSPANSARAQSLFQRVLAQNQPEAQPLHPLARLLAAQNADARRLEEQVERQTQQARDAQKRIDQLHDRLEALRAIERSLPSRPGAASGSGPAQPASATRP